MSIFINVNVIINHCMNLKYKSWFVNIINSAEVHPYRCGRGDSKDRPEHNQEGVYYVLI